MSDERAAAHACTRTRANRNYRLCATCPTTRRRSRQTKGVCVRVSARMCACMRVRARSRMRHNVCARAYNSYNVARRAACSVFLCTRPTRTHFKCASRADGCRCCCWCPMIAAHATRAVCASSRALEIKIISENMRRRRLTRAMRL